MDQGSLNLGMAASSPRVCPSLHRRQLAAKDTGSSQDACHSQLSKHASQVLKFVSLGLCVHVYVCLSGPKSSSPDYGIGCVSLW